MQNTIIRPKELKSAVGIGRTLCYSKINPKSKFYDPTFPLPIKLGERAVGWKLDELRAWLESRARGGSKVD
jgi:prophage regulatory protein